MNETKGIVAIIFSISVATSFLINSVMFTWEATRRPEDNRSVEQKRYESCVDNRAADDVHECDEFRKLIK